MKGDRDELAVEVWTGVGTHVIGPWAAALSGALWRGEGASECHAKWASTAREAAKQARRSWFPEVTPLADTATVLDLLAGVDLALVLHEGAQTPMRSVTVPESGNIALVVGPEGGVSDEELEPFDAAGVRAVRLGAAVLRTSTAGVAAVSALLAGPTPRGRGPHPRDTGSVHRDWKCVGKGKNG